MKCRRCGSGWFTQDHPGEFSCIPCGAVTYPANFVPLSHIVRDTTKVARQFRCGHPANFENTVFAKSQSPQCFMCHPELATV